MVKWGGVDPETGNALYMLKDDKDSEEFTAQPYNATKAGFSKQIVGSSLPWLQGGFNTFLEVYGVDFSIQFSYAVGGKTRDAPYLALMAADGDGSKNWHMDILNSWTPENPNSNIPRLEYNNQNLSQSSDRFLTDGSYLALRNISLGYTLPARISAKIKMRDLRIFVLADNVAIWSRRKGLDPRMSLSGSIENAYTPIRTISIGLNIKF